MEKSSTSRAQKIAIWVIMIAMAIGSLGAYFVIILANDNDKRDQEKLTKLQKQSQEQATMNNEPLDGYAPTPFDKASVTELKIEELVAGTGKQAAKTSMVSANYFGWTSDGAIFDSSKKSGTVTPAEFSLSGVIEGWTEGLTGASEGSVRKLTIPASKAYGDPAPTGYPSGPLMFIVKLEKVK